MTRDLYKIGNFQILKRRSEKPNVLNIRNTVHHRTFTEMEFIIKLAGVWLGVLARMTLPFWRKLYQSKITRFNMKYLRMTIASLVLSTIFTILLFPKLDLEPQEVINLESGFKLFCLCFGFGFGINSILTEFTKWFEKK